MRVRRTKPQDDVEIARSLVGIRERLPRFVAMACWTSKKEIAERMARLEADTIVNTGCSG